MDSWEEGFDNWTPPQGTPRAAPGDDTGTELDRAELLRLARELAESRRVPVAGTDSEVEQLKQSLRERAEAIATREAELAALQRKLERDRTGIRGRLELRPKRADTPVDGEAIVARERATYERAKAGEQRQAE